MGACPGRSGPIGARHDRTEPAADRDLTPRLPANARPRRIGRADPGLRAVALPRRADCKPAEAGRDRTGRDASPRRPARRPRPPRPRRSACRSQADGGQAGRPDAPAAAKPGGTLVAGWDSDPGALDNNLDRGAVTRTLLHMVYDRIVERDISVKADFPPFGPGLATSWEVSPDAKVYTFKLRQGVKFHDGTPCDAEAIKFNIERNWNPSHPLLLTRPAPARTPSATRTWTRSRWWTRSTVRVTHKTPFADFLNVLAFGTYSIGSPTQIQKVGNDEFGNQPVGTGPFKYVSRERGVKMVFEKNPDYWGGAPALDGFIIRPLPGGRRPPDRARDRRGRLGQQRPPGQHREGPGEREPGHRAGPASEHLGLHPEPPRRADQERQGPAGAQLGRQPRGALQGHHARAGGPLDQPVRADRHRPATTRTSRGTASIRPRRRRCSAEAGYKGEELRFQIPQGAVGSPFAVQMNQYLQQNFKDVGINVKIETLEAQVMQDNLSNGMRKRRPRLQRRLQRRRDGEPPAALPLRPGPAERQHQPRLDREPGPGRAC